MEVGRPVTEDAGRAPHAVPWGIAEGVAAIAALEVAGLAYGLVMRALGLTTWVQIAAFGAVDLAVVAASPRMCRGACGAASRFFSPFA